MNGATDIRKLIIVHRLKTGPSNTEQSEPAGPTTTVNNRGLFLDTCLRQLSIDLMPAPTHYEMQHEGAEILFGVDAYRFLLEITTGLRSAIPGETNVFGQFKNAWQNFRRNGPDARVTRLAPLVHKLSNDTKTIRREHLQGIGGASYGSLVRRLIAPAPNDRVLFVGAGNLALSMLPFFSNYELGIWNRRPATKPLACTGRVFFPEHGDRAAEWADQVILTTPPDVRNDANWRAWIGAADVKAVIHLGRSRGHEPRSHEPGGEKPGGEKPGDEKPGDEKQFGLGTAHFDLDDVFALRRRQTDIRSRQLVRARTACRQHAASYLYDDPDLPVAGSSGIATARLRTA